MNEKADYSGQSYVQYLGKINSGYEISSPDQLDSLEDFHIWEKSYLVDRFNFRPTKPLICYVLDIFKIKLPKRIEYDPEKARGCTSWFDLEKEVEVHSFQKINDSFQVNKALRILEKM